MVERNRQEQIRKIMSAAPSGLIQEVGYVPNEPVPDYQYIISVVERVRSIATHLHQIALRVGEPESSRLAG